MLLELLKRTPCFDGLMLALTKFGTKSFAEVAQPAIEYAEQGFPMPEEFGGFLRGYRNIMMLWPDSMQYFYPEGKLVKVGEVFREPTYAKTLHQLVDAERTAKGPRLAGEDEGRQLAEALADRVDGGGIRPVRLLQRGERAPRRRRPGLGNGHAASVSAVSAPFLTLRGKKG